MNDQISEIKERNARVEADKAWETSKIRRMIVAAVTYLIAVIFMKNIGVPDPFLNALVPTGGYVLSTLSLSVVKKWWVSRYTENQTSEE